MPNTRLACGDLLKSFGVDVRVENADGPTMLKCRVTELRGASCCTLGVPLAFRAY